MPQMHRNREDSFPKPLGGIVTEIPGQWSTDTPFIAEPYALKALIEIAIDFKDINKQYTLGNSVQW